MSYYQSRMCEINNMSENSTSLKDQGNEEFKRGNYLAAIEYYSQYVLADNSDNEKAYTNLAMSHFKLGNYYPCIEACRKALLKDCTFAKAYYRLYLAYKELPDEQYNTFVNANLFLKNFKEANNASRLEALEISNEFKAKFKSKKKPAIVHNISILQDLLRVDSEVIKKEGEVGSIHEWEAIFTSKKLSREQKIAKVQQEMEKDFEGGINLGHMYLNSIDRRDEKKYVAQRIHQIKNQLAERKKYFAEDLKYDQIAEESSQNLFQSQKEQQAQQQPITFHQKTVSSCSVPQQYESPSQEITKTRLHQPSGNIQVKNIQQKSQYAPAQSESTSEIIEKIIEKRVIKQIALDLRYSASISARLSKSRDVFQTLQEIIMEVLQCNASLDEKRSFLLNLPKSIREISMIRSSFSIAAQKIIYSKLKQIGLQSLSEVYSPKGR